MQNAISFCAGVPSSGPRRGMRVMPGDLQAPVRTLCRFAFGKVLARLRVGSEWVSSGFRVGSEWVSSGF
eukprot:2914915-Alexandrium_andersonii.AAC.1